MEKLNWGRVVLGGMLAGVVLIVLAAASTALFRQPGLPTAMQALRPSTGGSGAPLFFIFAFLFLGVLMVWWYAAIRPRFGPGPKTAAIAGFAVWLLAVGQLLRSVALYETVSLPPGPMLPILYLGMIVASTEVGAWVYKE
jgi:hypothetical protein